MRKYTDMSFREIVLNIETLKASYNVALMSFLNSEKLKLWKELIYSFNIREWQKDRLWEYLNNDISISELRTIAGFENFKNNGIITDKEELWKN